MDSIVTTITNCAACYSNHANVTFDRIDNPVTIGTFVYEYLYITECPTTGVKIYMAVIDNG